MSRLLKCGMWNVSKLAYRQKLVGRAPFEHGEAEVGVIEHVLHRAVPEAVGGRSRGQERLQGHGVSDEGKHDEQPPSEKNQPF